MFKYIRKLLALSTLALPLFSVAATDLADKPLLTGNSVQGNVALALSVEFPTALGSAYYQDPDYSNQTDYKNAKDYIGYFDNKKCYDYNGDTNVELRYFKPVAAASNHQCVQKWSGNFLNYALTQTIDPLRKALTGGYRSVDTTSLTVLEKAYASGQGGSVNSPSISADANLYTPFSWTSVSVGIAGLGKKFNITKSGSVYSGSPTEIGTTSVVTIPKKLKDSDVYTFYARANVCVAGMLEDNCTQYGANYKPTGLIQTNSKKLNFAAFGYLNDPGTTPPLSTVDWTKNEKIDGGVLRAKMAALGPLIANPGSIDTPNPNKEWDAATGIFYPNPDPADASTTETNNGLPIGAVPNSGVINYLNKFGLTSRSYKRYDPVSELYYAVIRYFKNQGNVPEYTNMAGYNAADKVVLADGFPVITNWNDPIQYSCQANFIIGVGDANTHVDGNLPGSTTPGIPSNPMPAAVSADKTVNVKTATNRVGALEGIGNIGGYWTGDYNTRQIAGLAFDSHTVDIRPDIPNTPDKQTVTTYWLDVLETTWAYPQGYQPDNQYELAAKFGGFAVPAGFDPYLGSTTPLATSTWNKSGRKVISGGKSVLLPDNYYMANDPGAMIDGLNNAFADILSKLTGSSNTFAVISPYVQTGAMSFATSYKADTWTGNVVGKTVAFTGNTPVETLAWNASEKLDAQGAGTGWNSDRKIATSTCTADVDGTQKCAGTPFRPDNLTSLLPNFAALPANQANAVNFLRGDASNTGSLGTASFRSRASLLGDIVNSKVVAVGPPRAHYTEDFNPGYIAFKNNPVNAARATVAYVGANDGMLHAFNGVTAGGNELFAYVPNALIKGPTNTPLVNGLAALAQPVYNHKYFVDATPVIADVDFGVSDWHSVLIGGLGKGGKAYYALDVTNPAGITSEGILSTNVLWEFTHKNMGYSYDIPLVVKTKKHGWTVILTSGYNNADGKGYFFLVDPKTGALLESISTGEGTTTNDAGLAHVDAFVADIRDGLTDAAYAGDALGNVWRLDLSGTGTIPAPKKIAAFGSTHPITVSPIIEVDQSTLKRYVYVGTGRILADSDVKSTDEQYFYAILDGTLTAPFLDGTEGKGPSTLPSGGSYPVTPLQMVDDTNTITTTGVIADNTKPMGYFIDLGTNGGSPYRVNVDMISSAGVVAFAANSLGGDACSPSGNNKLYAVTYGGGKSVIVDSSKTFLASFAGTGLATSISFFRPIKSASPDTPPDTSTDTTTGTSISISDNTGKSGSLQINPSSATGFTPLNWRELPTSD